tara:strand:+ start:264 stop:419 length:156 start_codon:yes stop_codon:yes gene_type:complete
MKPKKVMPIVGVAAIAALGAVGFLKRDSLIYKLYQKTYKHQMKKENITPFN